MKKRFRSIDRSNPIIITLKNGIDVNGNNDYITFTTRGVSMPHARCFRSETWGATAARNGRKEKESIIILLQLYRGIYIYDRVVN